LPLQKFQADYIFNGYHLLDKHHVLITDEKGKVLDIVDETHAGENIKQLNGIICPGLVNAHCHLELSHLKNTIPEKTGLVDFVFKVVTQRNSFSEDFILQSIADAENEMLHNGIVAVGDICNNTSTLFQKQKNNIAYYNFIEVSGWMPNVARQRFQEGQIRISNFEFRISTLVPHAPYSVSEDLWNLLKSSFQNKTVTIHNQETKAEDELFKNGTGDFIRMYKMMNMDNSFYKPYGKSSVQTYLHHFEKVRNVILVHNTFTKEDDIQFIQQQNQSYFFCLCPQANKYIENSLPPVDLLKKNNCNIVLGTDSLAGNHTLNLLDEMKLLQQNFSTISLSNMLQWATINGAKALQMDNVLGSFEKGKRPGINLIKNLRNNIIVDETVILPVVNFE
jgi:cytosine/adenosine deaminase-related metal-dependent hydrolase